jgi:hypothetical protein
MAASGAVAGPNALWRLSSVKTNVKIVILSAAKDLLFAGSRGERFPRVTLSSNRGKS